MVAYGSWENHHFHFILIALPFAVLGKLPACIFLLCIRTPSGEEPQQAAAHLPSVDQGTFFELHHHKKFEENETHYRY
jgi:hypothetical protein